jgi:hypothetical protein
MAVASDGFIKDGFILIFAPPEDHHRTPASTVSPKMLFFLMKNERIPRKLTQFCQSLRDFRKGFLRFVWTRGLKVKYIGSGKFWGFRHMHEAWWGRLQPTCSGVGYSLLVDKVL